MPEWLLPLLLIAPDLLSSIFGSKKETPTQTQTTTQEGFKGWQSPAYGMMEPYMLKLLMGNQDLFSGFGMPAGANTNLGMGGMFNDILSLLESEWPTIMQGYKKSSLRKPGEAPQARSTAVTKGG